MMNLEVNCYDTWMRKNTESDPLVLLSHPVPTCASCGRRGHSKRTCEDERLRDRRNLSQEDEIFVSLLAE